MPSVECVFCSDTTSVRASVFPTSVFVALAFCLAATADGTNTCAGVIGSSPPGGGWIEPLAGDATNFKADCWATVRVADCATAKDLRWICPESCNYLMHDSFFPCFLTCVPADGCVRINSAYAFPNDETGLCERCSVRQCKKCRNGRVCDECFPGFVLDNNECRFELDRSMHAENLAIGLAVALAAIVVAIVFHKCTDAPHKQLQQHNKKSIMLALEHRERCKVHKWTEARRRSRGQFGGERAYEWLQRIGPEDPKHTYPLWHNMHSDMVLGRGVALFYNSLVFLAIVSMVLMFGTYVLDYYGPWAVHGLDSVVYLFGSRKPTCKDFAHLDYKSELDRYARIKFQCCCCLYGIIFIVSLIYCYFQKKHAERFDRRHFTMEDYAVLLSGLDPCDTCEARVAEEAKRCFEHMLQRPVAIVGVSIAYRYHKIEDDVNEVLFRHMERHDVESGIYGPGLCSTGAPASVDSVAGYDSSSEQRPCMEAAVAHTSRDQLCSQVSKDSTHNMYLQKELDATKVRSWFEGSSKLKGSGRAYIVFGSTVDVEDIERMIAGGDNTVEWHCMNGSTRHVKVRIVLHEPTAVFWWNYGLSTWRFVCRLILRALRILLSIILFGVFVFIPLAVFVILPWTKTGSGAGGLCMTLVGILMGNMNCWLCIHIWMTSFGLGFELKDGMDRMIFFSNCLLNLLNTSFNLWIVISMGFSPRESAQQINADFFFLNSQAEVAAQAHTSMLLYNMIVPGFVFMGYLTWILMAGIVPFFVNLGLANMIYRWRLFPTLLARLVKLFLPWSPDNTSHYPARNAAKALETMEVAIPWDYADNIVVPCLCFSMLFFVSPYIWRTFFWCLIWVGFRYCFYRFIHLRFNKACFYTTHRLDVAVNYVWGVPLAVLAAACGFWAARCGFWGLDSWRAQAPVFAAAASLLIWWLAYSSLRPLHIALVKTEGEIASYESVSAELLYNWFNVNPLYVLKSEFCPDLLAGHPEKEARGNNKLRFFEVGKQFLMQNYNAPVQYIPASGFDAMLQQVVTVAESALQQTLPEELGNNDDS